MKGTRRFQDAACWSSIAPPHVALTGFLRALIFIILLHQLLKLVVLPVEAIGGMASDVGQSSLRIDALNPCERL